MKKIKKIKKLTKKQIRKLEKREIKRRFKVWSERVKERDNYKCVICGRTEFIHCHHVIPRENKEFRFDIDNGITLCSLHHKFSLDISPHRNPFVFFNWFKELTQSDILLHKAIPTDICGENATLDVEGTCNDNLFPI